VTPKDWEALKPLFEQALRLSPEECAAFVERVRLDDEELGRNLADLISEDKTLAFDKPFIDFHEVPPDSPIASGASPTDETVTLSALRAGEVVAGRFRLLRHAGKGGMGDVFEAEDLQLKDRIALKVIRPEIASNPLVSARFKREILLGKRIAHPNVCRIHDLGFTKSGDGAEMLFLTMEFLSGETLASRIKRGPLSSAEALPLIENMADGLAAAHHAGIVHRDFKSGNVMLVNSPDGIRSVVTDFGLARAVHESTEGTAITKPGAVAGTVGYMAPEQIRGGKVTPAADIYALGVVVFQMVTGRLPFTGDSDVSVALQHLNEAPPSPRKFAPNLDVSWETAILGCLRKVPQERFGSAADFKAALLSRSAKLRPKPSARLRRTLAVSLPVAMAILLVCALWAYRARNAGLMNSQQRVAVLEFENVGGDEVNRAFCEGLMEALSSELTELEPFHRSLSVVPASDVRKEKVTSAREAQSAFGVNLVITGSVQRSPSGVRLTINVVDARQLKQLRSRSIFIPETDAVSMQQGVITQVTDLLDIQLHPDAQHRLAEGNTPVPGAYDFYLQGSGYLLSGRAAADHAIVEFEHALERDPDYALAHAGLGEAYWNKYSLTKDSSWIDKAWQQCRRSIELGPQLSGAHITLALLNSGTGHYDEAIRQARQAILIDPYSDRAYAELARARRHGPDRGG
jgi:serine/threonine protein kinase